MPEIKALAKLSVEFYIDAERLRDAEKLVDHWLRIGEDDDRLVSYRVSGEEWVPDTVSG
jgi:hypothetical protein